MAMGDWGDAEAFDFLVNEFKDPALPVRIRRAILAALAQIDEMKSMPYLLEALGRADVSIRETAATLLGQIGQSAMEPVLGALHNPRQEPGALLALQSLPVPPEKPVEEYARTAAARAVEYDSLRRGVHTSIENQAGSLLAEALKKKSDEYGVRALRAIGLLEDRETMDLVIEALHSQDPAQRATLLEALESLEAHRRRIIQPLMDVWEAEADSEPDGKVDWQRLLSDEDAWLRDCAHFAMHKLGEGRMENIATLSLMERILFFKGVPLFANLSPADLKQVAAIAQEESFSDGDTIADQGEAGDVMFIILSGEVRVVATKDRKEIELARRKAGEYVGEMALISREPRIARLTAVGSVHALCLDQKSFTALLRDRPDASLAVIQDLCKRLKEASERVDN